MARSSRHWYVLGPDGSVMEAHGLGIKDARKARAFISPTTVIQEVRATPFNLVKWQRQQLVQACVDAPKVEGEDLDNYYDRVNELSYRRSDTATDFGKKIHAIAEHFPAVHLDENLMPWYTQLADWHERHVADVLSREERVVDKDIGVAGTLDLRCCRLNTNEIAIVDFKTQGIKDRIYYGESWPKQLAAYANAVRKKYGLPNNPKCINVVIDSSAPNPLTTKEWSVEEINNAYEEFLCEVWLWSRDHNHWPVGLWNLSQVLQNQFLCPKN
jgi:hypothetical protein